MDLIERKAAIEAVKIEIPEPCNPEERYGIIYAKVEARKNIRELPSAPAVPLDNLCEWLQVNANYNSLTKRIFAEQWREILTEWMEEQDAAD